MPLELKFGRILGKAAKEKLEIVLSAPLQGEAGGRGVWGEFRPPSPLMKSVRIFSNTHRQSENVSVGSPSTRARQPILGTKLNFVFVPRSGTPEAGFFEF